MSPATICGRARRISTTAALREIFTEHNPDDRIGVTSNLSREELDDLEAFLLQIDDVPTLEAPPSARGCRVGERLTPASLVGLLLLTLRRRKI